MGGRIATIAVALALTAGVSGPALAAEASNVRLRSHAMRERVAHAVARAAARIERPRCASLLDQFQDGSGTPLRRNLEAIGVSAPEYLSRIFFYDGLNDGRCRSNGVLATTEPGSNVVMICTRFLDGTINDWELADEVVLHEAFHTLGLGENPPSSQEITARVLKACR